MTFDNSQQFKKTTLWTSLSAILAVIVLGSWFLYYHFERVQERESWVRHTGKVIDELNLFLSSVKDVETGLRAYLLTDMPTYRQRFEEGMAFSTSRLQALNVILADNPAQQNALDALEQTLNEHFQLLTKLRKENSTAENRNFNKNHEDFDESKRIMDSLRMQIEIMKGEEKSLLAIRSARADLSSRLFVWSLLLVSLFSIGAVSFAFMRFHTAQVRAEKEALSKAQEAWNKKQVADLSQILSGTLRPEKVAERVLEFVREGLPVLASRFYVLENGNLQLVGSKGVESEAQKTISKPNNLLTEAIETSKVISLNQVPAGFWKLNSSMGESQPSSLVIVPVSFRGEDLGVIELASFEAFNAQQVEVLGSLIETIGAAMSSAQSRFYLQELLEKTQMQAEELQSQQEELKASNEELEQQARALEDQQQTLSIKNKELEVIRYELERRATELKQSSQYKSEFLAKMSHELRTPLNGLLILSTLLTENKEKNLTEQQKQFAQSIHDAGDDLLALINDILDLSKIEAKKLKLRAEEFSMNSVLEHLRVSFAPQFDSKSLSFEVVVDDSIAKKRLFTDLQRLEQILRNFMSNALKFTQEGGVKLKVESASKDKAVQFSVIDTGVGIAPEKQKLIFEAFEQADSSISRTYGGTGLGLTISKELAIMLGGSISLKSDQGKGSEFSLTIPIELGAEKLQSDFAVEEKPIRVSQVSNEVIEEATSPEIQNKAREALAKVKGKKRSILIVEDDDSFRSSVVDATKEYGFDAIESADGEVALAILNEHTPDAVLLDIKLPGISGLGLLEMMKKLPHLRHVPVHMISALDYQHNALRMGALGYLTKPVTLEKIHSALNRIEDLLSEKVRRVLLIEDDQRQSVAISELVSGKDVNVTVASSGKEAISHLKEGHFECIILDLSLPDYSGVELLSELNDLDISIPPVVIYTAKDLTSGEEEYLRRFSESIIIKGARSPERLLDEVNLFLHRVESLLPEAKKEMLSALRSRGDSFEGSTVLLVDDDLRNVFALTSALESKGATVRIAKNGIEAIESVEKFRDIDLVLMDIMMPQMDGFEAMRRIRKHEDQQVRRIPIIALTAKAMRGDHEKCIEAGANDYLPKPVNMENLSTVMKVWLSPSGVV